jgi:hypothetical protein
MALALGAPNKYEFVSHDEFEKQILPGNDCYFGPALRKQRKNSKEAVAGTIALWADVDSSEYSCTLPPTIVVCSGHGYHLYWFLDVPLLDPVKIEELNKLLAVDTGGDHCWNANRFMRVPGTRNTKSPPAPVTIQRELDVHYTIEDITVLGTLEDRARKVIRTGSSDGFQSRSERDWYAIKRLQASGAGVDLIRRIFTYQPVGDKYQAEGDRYLDHTLARADTPAKAKERKASFVEKEDGYYIEGSRGVRRVSTFTFDPALLLDGSLFDSEDAIVGTIKAGEQEWTGRTLSRSAFNGTGRLDREMPLAAWQWLGNDHEIRMLLPYLMDKLMEQGLPKIAATPIIGLHKMDNRWYYVGTSGTLSADNYWPAQSGPIAWLPTHREHPTINLDEDVMPDEAFFILLTKVNEDAVLWPALGWYTASLIKPWIESIGYRFPIMSVAGTRGSGKTTLIQRILLPLFGQRDSKSFDAGTTRFVILALLGAANALPVAFSEFRAEYVERFLRYVLLAYDTGHDPRGRSDQTTIDYALSAPFTLDGEDVVEDPAARERIVAVHLNPATVAEGSVSYNAYNEIRSKLVSVVRPLMTYLLRSIEDNSLENIYADARSDMFTKYPSKLPDRVRNNHITVLFGAYAFCDAFGLTRPDPGVMERSIEAVFNLRTGRSSTMVDSFVEEIANLCAQGDAPFRWSSNDEAHTLYFQLTPAHNAWVTVCKRRGRTVLERDTIKTQLQEAVYSLPAMIIDGTWMYGVNVQAAQDAGLDVSLNLRERSIHF